MRWRTCCGALGLLAAAGCYQPPPAPHAVLLVGADGSLVFQGQPVPADGLAAAVDAATAGGPRLVVEIRTSPRTPMEPVERAVAAVKSARGIVAFAPDAAPP